MGTHNPVLKDSVKIFKDGYVDTLPRTLFKFADGTEETCCFDRSKWVWWWLKKDGTRQKLRGVTGTVHVMGGKTEALIGWAKRVVLEKLRRLVIERHLGPDEAIQMFVSELDTVIAEAKKANDEALELAGQIGHDAHAHIENVIKAVIAEDIDRLEELMALFPNDDRAANAVTAALLWCDKHNVRWVATERPVFSRDYGYCGTSDGICLCDSCDNPKCCDPSRPYKDLLVLCDWKTSNGKIPYLEYLFQTAAYVNGIAELDGIELGGRWINILDKTTAEFNSWFFPIETQEEDFRGFRRCLDLCESVESVDLRLDNMNDRRRAEIAIEKAAAKAEANKIDCGNKRYKGKRPPVCNGGQPCQACLTKYAEENSGKATVIQ
jgi:hypothetical protein